MNSPLYSILLEHVMRTWTGITLPDICRATDQIGYDMKRRIIAEDRGVCLKSGPLQSTISHYTIYF